MTSQLSNNKKIAKNTLFLYMRMIIVLAVSLFTVRIVLKTLGDVDYGLYSAVGGVVFSLSFISQVLTTAAQRFFSVSLGRDNSEELTSTLNTMFVVYIFLSIIIVLIIETVGAWFFYNKMTIPIERQEAAFAVLQFTLASFVAMIITNPFKALVIAHEDMNVFAYISILEVILKLVVVLFLSIVDADKLYLYAFLLFMANIVPMIIFVIFAFKKYKETKITFSFDKQIFKSVFSFSSWTLFGSLAYMLNTQGINILLNMFFGPAVNAAYAIGNQVKTQVNQFSSNFYSAVRPPLTKSYAIGDVKYMNRLFYLSSKIIFALLFALVLPLVIETENVLFYWLGDIKSYMVVFVRLLLIYGIILSMNDPITTIAEASGYVKLYHGIIDGFTILTLPTSYFLLKCGFGPQTACIVPIIIFTIAHIMRLFVLKRIIVFSVTEYLKRVLLPSLFVVVCSLLMSMGVKYFLDFGSLLSFLIRIAIYIIVSIILSYLFLLDNEERNSVLSLIKSKLKKET